MGMGMDKHGDVQTALDRERGDFHLVKPYAIIASGIALVWALVQLYLASPLPFWTGLGAPSGIPARGLHIGFAFALCFLCIPAIAGSERSFRPSIISLLIGALGVMSALYVYFNYDSIAVRAGRIDFVDIAGYAVPYEAIIGWTGLLVLVEATRRAVGLPLAIVALIFLLYSYFGQSMPDIIAHKGVSLTGLANSQWLTDQGVFGIPVDVAVRFIFLFVVFGAMLERAGAGQFFMDLALSLVGRYRGGPAKAAVLSSGMTGMVSGSSIANTVTTGTFTIPLMKKTGLSAERAGAIEVAASVNGQIMPPIMGAAAFVMAELLAISYFDVIYHAFIPAVISYIALFYITDLEAQRRGLKPYVGEGSGPKLGSALQIIRRQGYYLLPLVLLIYLLVGLRMTTGAAVFWSIMFFSAIIIVREIFSAPEFKTGLLQAMSILGGGLIQGAKNMISVAIALGAAGIVVGAVGQSGLSNALAGIVETLSAGNIYILLISVAILSLILGMGLPTTANYLVVATLMVPVIVKVGGANGLEVPLIAAHLFVFYFGLMADVTPPVALSAYAAAGISKGDPMKTGVTAFFYSIRTAILPFIFIFNTDLLLLDITNPMEAVMIFAVSLIAILAFTSLTFRWMLVRLKLVEMVLIAVACLLLFRPDLVMNKFYVPDVNVPTANLLTGIEGNKISLKVSQRFEDSSRMVKINAPASILKLDAKALGITGGVNENGAFEVKIVKFKGLAQKAGVKFGDVIKEVRVANTSRPSPRFLFIPALFMLGFVFLWQRRRLHSQSES